MDERLREIRQVIANELGLTENWLDGTYLYYLTRTKSAFSVGTVTLEDFEEIDDELLDNIVGAISPYFIKQSEQVEELKRDVSLWKNVAKIHQEKRKEAESDNEPYRHGNKRYELAMKKVKTYLSSSSEEDSVNRTCEVIDNAVKGSFK